MVLPALLVLWVRLALRGLRGLLVSPVLAALTLLFPVLPARLVLRVLLVRPVRRVSPGAAFNRQPAVMTGAGSSLTRTVPRLTAAVAAQHFYHPDRGTHDSAC